MPTYYCVKISKMCGHKALKLACSFGILVFLAGAVCTIVGATRLPTALPNDYYLTHPATPNVSQDLQTYKYESYGFRLIIIGCSVAGGGMLCCGYACFISCFQGKKAAVASRTEVRRPRASTVTAVDVGQPKEMIPKETKPKDVDNTKDPTGRTIVRFAEPSLVVRIDTDTVAPAEQFEDFQGVLFYKSTITLPFRFRSHVMINMNNQERINYIKRINSWLGATATQYYRIDFD